jgi:methylaspartate mutase epsilon subunit
MNQLRSHAIVSSPKLSSEVFNQSRSEVLETWATGKDLSLEEGIEYQKSIPTEKNFAVAMEKAAKTGEILRKPRAGVALIQEHINLFTA